MSETMPAIVRNEQGYVPALLLCMFLGTFGAHRFYVGKIGTGILQLVTLGGLTLWTLIDYLVIIFGNFQDSEGRVLKN